MKKAKKLLTLALCLLVLFATLAVAHAIDERGVELPSCPSCLEGHMVEKTERRTNRVLYPCEHYEYGDDTYRITEKRGYIKCDSCSYIESDSGWTVVSKVLVSCDGYNELQ